MNETGAVDGVLAVISRIMMAAGSIERALFDEGKKLRVGVYRRSALRRIIRVEDCAVIGDRRPCKRIRRSRPGHCCGRGVTDVVSATRIGHGGIGSAALVVQSQGITSSERHRNSIIE